MVPATLVFTRPSNVTQVAVSSVGADRVDHSVAAGRVPKVCVSGVPVTEMAA